MKTLGTPLSFALLALCAAANAAQDPYLWLEEIQGKEALAWVGRQNENTRQDLGRQTDYPALRRELLTILDSNDRIPSVEKIGGLYYNFWRDKDHPRGLWRRATLDEYRKAAPQWETVLDLDRLAKDEGENWVWQGADCLRPDQERCLLRLSRGGGDAAVVREFDPAAKAFVKDGFQLPEAKSEVSWQDRDTLYVMSDFGPGSLTDSGYPRIVKTWRRGQPLAEAQTVFEGQQADVAVHAARIDAQGRRYDLITRAPTFFSTEARLRVDGKWRKLDKPDHVGVDFFGDWLLLTPKQDWTAGGKTWRGGSLLAIKTDAYLAGERGFSPLFEPSAAVSLAEQTSTRDSLLLTMLDNVGSRLMEWKVVDGQWRSRPVATPSFGSISVRAVDPDRDNRYFYSFTDFLTPPTLALAETGSDERRTLKQQPGFFDAGPYRIQQWFAASRDGTRVPYFLVSRKDIKLDGSNPTLLYGYGGFEVSLTPRYNGALGKAWLERGGVYALANIRGGGEYGPAWHEAARKQLRQNAYDDFAAIAEDLAKRGVADARHLGIKGGSNGGLLMGVMLTQRPELFNAVVCQVPLLDMRRFNRLLAGASWMDEYGNPDLPEDWAYIRRYSPYQNLKADARYPATLFMTSTLDDRVHPGHARKMFAAMQAMGAPVQYFERTEGGHGAAANHQQEADIAAMEYAFLLRQLR